MNLLLIQPEELQPDGTALLRGRRVVHAREILKASAGESLRVGVLHGGVGHGNVVSIDAEQLRLELSLTEDPPPRPGVDLLLAIPRPKALKKVLPAIAALGVDRVVLVNAFKVEKSYFDSKVLEQQFVADLFAQGLEQARDTIPPRVLVRERFKPFVEDELDAVFGTDSQRLVADPLADVPVEAVVERRRSIVLAVGPEGGWIPFELELLAQHGFVPFTLGARILRVEVAVSYLLGRLAALRPSAA